MAKKKRKRKKEEEEQWFTDTSKDAQKKRMEAEFEGKGDSAAERQKQKRIADIMESAKGDNKSESPVTVLKVFLAERDRSVAEIVSELRRLQLSRGLDDSQRVKVLLEALVDVSDPATVVAQIKKNAPVLKHYATDRNTSIVLLGCLEELVGVIEPKLLSRIPMILQVLYEGGVLDEGSILGWHSAPPESSFMVNKKIAADVRKKAQLFIDWLQSAEEDGDD